MGHIEILDIATSNRIAAGEVVERPASVVKELIENSLDAQASAITVEIREGGIDYLRVTDNGIGLPPGEVRIAFERHATSKIRSGDALDQIGTLGFRGEALPSIAAVSRVELTSRQRGQESGMRIDIEGGRVNDLREAGCPEGTTFVMRDLFFNTPARRKFLKRAATEGGYVGDAVLQLALSRPDVSFRMINSGKTVFHTPGNGEHTAAIAVLFGREMSRQLIGITGRMSGLEIQGCLGLQDAARANRQHEYFFVNGRFVRSPLLALALEEACRGHIAIGKYPFAVLYFTVPPDSIDVNVHPNKLEVRFRDEGMARQAVIGIVEECLRPQSVQARVPLFPPEKPRQEARPQPRIEGATQPFPAKAQDAWPQEEAPKAERPDTELYERMFPPPPKRMQESAFALPLVPYSPPEKPMPAPVTAPVEEESEAEETVAPAAQQAAPVPPPEPIEMAIERVPPRLIGTLFSTYMLVQHEGSLLVIDQHAAHERLLYEQLMASMEQGAHAQSLLIPYSFQATPREREKLLENLDMLSTMGFAIEEFGESAFRVDAVPHILGEPQLKEFFIELLDNLDRISQLKALELKRDAIAGMACHKAVKGGDVLTQAELTRLLAMVLDENTPLTCPHGRPILLKMTRAELERRFRRIQG